MARKSEMTGTIPPSTAAATPSASPASVATGDMPGNRASASAQSDPPPEKRAGRFRKDERVPAGLVSLIVHTILFVILALFSYQGRGQSGSHLQGRRGEPSNTLSLDAADQLQPESDDTSLAPLPVQVALNPLVSSEVTSPLDQPQNSTLSPATIAMLKAGGGDQAKPNQFRLPKGGLEGRTAEGRKKYGRKHGATIESEKAVDEALRWLADHQQPNGSWSFNLNLEPCNGRCRHSKKTGDTPTPVTGATGLALLAFLGAGHTHHKAGPYQETVRRGIYYLRAAAGETEAGYDFQRGSMYGHGIAVMALAEALAMTSDGEKQDRDLVDLVHRAAWFTAVAQHNNGSWGYVPGSPGDTTLTGWQVLSLVAAKRSDAPMKTYTLHNARDFILSTSEKDEYSFGYQHPPGEDTTTAIGLTLLLYLGESPHYTPFFNAITDMAARGPKFTNVYHDYYATLALHHTQHPYWDDWNSQLRDFLVDKQAKTGHERGSWHFKDRWGDVGGRLYTTAMCAMILEVYYRYMPLYGEIEEFPL